MTAVSRTKADTRAGALTASSLSRSGQFSSPLTTTGAIPAAGFSAAGSAIVKTPAFLLPGIPPPPPNRIGEVDHPGGFKKPTGIQGQTAPLYDLSRGIVQIDGVAVLFDISA